MGDRTLFHLVRTMLLGGQSPVVLADFLEEQGHPLADWVRQATKTVAIIQRLANNGLSALDILDLPIPHKQRLNLLLTQNLLEEKELNQLGCDFVGHLLPTPLLTPEQNQTLQTIVSRFRVWLAHPPDTHLRRSLFQADSKEMEYELYELGTAITQRPASPEQEAQWVIVQLVTKLVGKNYYFAFDMACQAAYSAGRVAVLSGRRDGEHQRRSHEMRWQLLHIREVIQATCAAGGSAENEP